MKNHSEVKNNPRKVIREDLNIDEGDITINEIEVIIKRFKTNKAPGPDKSTTELYKLLYIPNLKYIAKLLNLLWNLEAVPEELTEANVASIFKKGDTQNLANYRQMTPWRQKTLNSSFNLCYEQDIFIMSIVENTRDGYLSGLEL